MLLYIDPATGPVIFSGITALMAAFGSGILVFLAFLFKPVRKFFLHIWRFFFKGKQDNEPETPGQP